MTRLCPLLLTCLAGADGPARTTRQRALTIPGFTLWHAALRHTTRVDGGTHQQIGLNVNNILDRDYLKVSQQQGDRRAEYLTYSFGAGGRRH